MIRPPDVTEARLVTVISIVFVLFLLAVKMALIEIVCIFTSANGKAVKSYEMKPCRLEG